MAKKQELCQKGIFRLELCLCFLRREVMLNVTDRELATLADDEKMYEDR